MPRLKDKVEELKAISEQVSTVFDEAGEDLDFEQVKSIEGDDNQTTEQKVAWLNDANAKMADLQAEIQELRDLEVTRDHAGQLKTVLDLMDAPANHLAGIVERTKDDEGDKGAGALIDPHGSKSFHEAIQHAWTDSDGKGLVGDIRDREIRLDDVNVKALFQRTAGWPPETTRTGLVVPFATRPVQVTQIFPTGTTTQAAVVYMEETTYTQAAAEIAEGGAYPESAFELTERSSPVQKIGHFVPATDEQLEDVPEAGSYLNNRLTFGLEQRLDGQLINGDGVAPNLEGVLARTGIQTQPKGADPVPDAVLKALTLVRTVGYAIPNWIVMNSTDWQNVRLLRTADGIYIWGNPSEAGPQVMWGIPVVENQVIAQGTALTGDFANFSELTIRRGISVKVSDSHADYFTNGKQAIRADMRAALQVYRPAAFCQVTGL